MMDKKRIMEGSRKDDRQENDDGRRKEGDNHSIRCRFVREGKGTERGRLFGGGRNVRKKE